ncbi:hypothetical protein QCA50_014295 [Cerrena zonata]|uniref:Uncharacterized protein n=1 Tax=Cerrena zonata TaxID=2478898 RepID=A0AAW0G0G9_9APHY
MATAYKQADNDVKPEDTRNEILGFTAVLSVLQHQLDKPLPHTSKKGHKTADDFLIHIANMLNTGFSSKIVVALSGPPEDLTLTVVAKEELNSDTTNDSEDTSEYPLFELQ